MDLVTSGLLIVFPYGSCFNFKNKQSNVNLIPRVLTKVTVHLLLFIYEWSTYHFSMKGLGVISYMI